MAILTLYERYRPMLLRLAYRMTGSVADAEDLVQDSFIALETATEPVAHPKAFLVKVLTNRCINYLQSARKRRERYVGPWLPEPWLAAPEAAGPESAALQEAELSTAMLVVLERLNPVERAVFLLREMYCYEYDEIARLVGKTPANCRKLFSRARQKVGADPPAGQRAAAAEQWALVRQFLDAFLCQDMDRVLALLAEDVQLYSDGGGEVVTALLPVDGRDRVFRMLAGLAGRASGSLRLRLAVINGGPGLIAAVNGQATQVVTFGFGAGIDRIFIQANPQKLGHVT